MPSGATAVLIMAAGQGARFGGDIPKQYKQLAGRAPLQRAVDAFARHPGVAETLCVIDADAEALYRDLFQAGDALEFVVGGATRQASVRNGLEALARSPSPPERVLIHDAARPIVPGQIVDDLIRALDAVDAAAPALSLTDTVSHSDGHRFGDEVDRSSLVRRQTPQAFRFAKILEAHRAHEDVEVTDDIALARLAGLATAMTEGSQLLHKLTTPEDQQLLEAMLARRMTASVGNGFDVHAFGPGDGLTLCGVHISHDRALVGHSDADVAMHALTDAMLGAVGAGDIGQLYPPSDDRWKGADSTIFLAGALSRVHMAGATLESVDVTIICEAPKVGPHRDAMRARLADLLGLAPDRVNVKATTTERLGFAGRGEGIAALATATVTRCA